jgi:hypothetical protein
MCDFRQPYLFILCYNFFIWKIEIRIKHAVPNTDLHHTSQPQSSSHTHTQGGYKNHMVVHTCNPSAEEVEAGRS